MRTSILNYLDKDEIGVLIKAEATVRLVYEVAELRAENERLRTKAQNEYNRQHTMLQEQNKQIGNILMTIIDKHDK